MSVCCGIGNLAEFPGSNGGDQQTDNGQPSRPDFVKNNPCDRRHNPHQNRTRQQHQTGFHRRKAADRLQVNRQQNHTGVHGHCDDNVDNSGQGVHVVTENAELQQRFIRCKLTPHEQDQGYYTQNQAGNHCRTLPAVGSGITEAVQQSAEADGRKNNSQLIQLR
ncbi:hypothetical protein D3C73_1337960 [compost metagenome]